MNLKLLRNRPVGDELFHANGKTSRQTDKTKVIGACGKFDRYLYSKSMHIKIEAEMAAVECKVGPLLRPPNLP